MKEFKEGDTVYWSTLKGKVWKQFNDDSSTSLAVRFENNLDVLFTKDGRYFNNTPVVLSHFPYEIEMKKVEPVIEKDTKVWYRDDENEWWRIGYYSHFENKRHYVFDQSKKSCETSAVTYWNIVLTEDPLL